MTAINETDTRTLSQAHALSTLETAPLGTVAHSPNHPFTPLVRMTNTGTPWMRDPWGEGLGAERLTSAYAASLGYYAPQVYEEHPEPTMENALAQIETLRADGMSLRDVAARAMISTRTLQRVQKGATTLSVASIMALMSTPTESARGYCTPTIHDRLEDFEFLLDLGVSAQEAAVRCGWSDYEAPRKSVERHGNATVKALYAAALPRLDDEDDFPEDDAEF